MGYAVAPIILAAGQGTRMRHRELPKVLVPFAGKPMIAHTLHAVREAQFALAPTIVVGYRDELVKKALGFHCQYVLQSKQCGTGHAVAVCRSPLEGRADAILVLYGDHPFVTTSTMQRLVDEVLLNGATIALATTIVADFTDWRATFEHFGRIRRDSFGAVTGIVEYRDASEKERNIKELSPAYYCFNAAWLWEHIGKLQPNNTQGEYYLTDLVAMAVTESAQVTAIDIPPEEAFGINTPEQLAMAEELFVSVRS